MWLWLMFLVNVSTLTVIIGASQPKLQIQPEGAQIKPIGSGLALICTPNVENPNLITQLEWRDSRNRRIDTTDTKAPVYIQRAYGETNIVLIFSKLTENLAGTYTCAANYASSEQLVASTNVVTIIGITWVDAPESQYPVIGQDYKVRCEIKANPEPIVYWLKDGEEINVTSSNRYITDQHGLLIKKVKESDDGVYTCRAVVFKTGQIEAKNIKPVEVVEGEEASIICNGTGKPPPSFTWIKEKTRQDLSVADRFTVKKNTGSLVIHKVEFNDDSFYKCVAENNAGRNETVVKINVLVKPKIYEFLNITEPLGNAAKIVCKAQGRPAPAIFFRKLTRKDPYDNGQQQYDPRIKQESYTDEEKGETIGVLNFNKLRRTDDGLYACIAENKVETAYKNGHITVEFPPSFEKTENYPPVWSWENHPGNLTCIAESIPNATIQWKFNGLYIEDNNTANIQRFGNGPISYLIITPNNDHRLYSQYECIATNKWGSASKLIELRKATVPEHIQHVTPESVTATTIKFNIGGPPNFRGIPVRSITVQYQTERERTWSTAREHTWSYNATYILENLVPEEVYNFRFAARNDVGMGGWSGNQQIQMPRRSVPAEPKLILDGQLPDIGSNYVAADLVTESHYADHYKLQWTVPNDNGDPIDSYVIRYCVTQKVNGLWRDSESECSDEITQSYQHTTYEMSDLRPDTTYKVELRAHNAIGSSSPAEIRVRTARGLSSVVYESGNPSISSAAIIGIVVAAILVALILVDVLCCCINHAGIIAFIYDQVHSKPVDDEDSKLGRDEKEPLKPAGKEDPIIINGVDKCNMSVEYDGKQVYTKPGEIIGKHSVV
ncbi:hypothetical protein RN001_002712 [Aquatica leii]|uniref:Fasciclin-2 n=1 Tax=Aquatica leii TaxID=1421715 RepID=A0AAN7SDG8_9COLE|nr:hypothetical protein RN001_002712 [Aquatica leii]